MKTFRFLQFLVVAISISLSISLTSQEIREIGEGEEQETTKKSQKLPAFSLFHIEEVKPENNSFDGDGQVFYPSTAKIPLTFRIIYGKLLESFRLAFPNEGINYCKNESHANSSSCLKLGRYRSLNFLIGDILENRNALPFHPDNECNVLGNVNKVTAEEFEELRVKLGKKCPFGIVVDLEFHHPLPPSHVKAMKDGGDKVTAAFALLPKKKNKVGIKLVAGKVTDIEGNQALFDKAIEELGTQQREVIQTVHKLLKGEGGVCMNGLIPSILVNSTMLNGSIHRLNDSLPREKVKLTFMNLDHLDSLYNVPNIAKCFFVGEDSLAVQIFFHALPDKIDLGLYKTTAASFNHAEPPMVCSVQNNNKIVAYDRNQKEVMDTYEYNQKPTTSGYTELPPRHSRARDLECLSFVMAGAPFSHQLAACFEDLRCVPQNTLEGPSVLEFVPGVVLISGPNATSNDTDSNGQPIPDPVKVRCKRREDTFFYPAKEGIVYLETEPCCEVIFRGNTYTKVRGECLLETPFIRKHVLLPPQELSDRIRTKYDPPPPPPTEAEETAKFQKFLEQFLPKQLEKLYRLKFPETTQAPSEPSEGQGVYAEFMGEGNKYRRH